MRVNAAWIILIVTFGGVGILALYEASQQFDLPIFIALIALAFCGGTYLRLCYRKTVGEGEREKGLRMR